MKLRVDPCDARSMVAAGGEYLRAIEGAREQLRSLPDAVIIQLYAYELLERARERQFARSEELTWVVPFWPPGALQAAGIAAHAWPEIARMLPEFAAYEFMPRPEAVIAGEAVRIFGEQRFDPKRYLAAMHRCAETAGWTCLDPSDAPC